MTASPTHSPPPGGVDYVAVEESAPFRELKRKHRSFVWPLTIVFLVWYFVYVLLSSFATDFMAQRVTRAAREDIEARDGSARTTAQVGDAITARLRA